MSGRRTTSFWQTGWVKGVEFTYLRCVGLNHFYITYYILTRKSGRKLRNPTVKFTTKPHQELTEDRALILQGRNQEGKTTLLRETIPRHRRWGPQMFGMTTTGGSEIDCNLQAYKNKQWFLGFWRVWDCPSPPSPPLCWWISLKSSWSASQCKPWTVQTHGPTSRSETTLPGWSSFATQMLAHRPCSIWTKALALTGSSWNRCQGKMWWTWTRSCSGNIGMYKLVENRIRRQELTKEQVVDFARKTCLTPWSMTGHGQSWTWSWWKRGWKSPLRRHSAQRRRMARMSSPKGRSTLRWALPKGYGSISTSNRFWTPPRSCGGRGWREQVRSLQSLRLRQPDQGHDLPTCSDEVRMFFASTSILFHHSMKLCI